MTIAEIRFGIERVTDPAFRAELDQWLRDGLRLWFAERILPVDEAVLLVWRRLADDGRKAGHTWSQPDALIAATALVHELGIVTRNQADFERADVAISNPWIV